MNSALECRRSLYEHSQLHCDDYKSAHKTLTTELNVAGESNTVCGRRSERNALRLWDLVYDMGAEVVEVDSAGKPVHPQNGKLVLPRQTMSDQLGCNKGCGLNLKFELI